jgi:phosphoenolpyruvate---glycerone phosphotransferase subunit DhaM
MPVGVVIVSHSRRLAEGVREIADQMAAGMVTIRTAGGTEDGSLGTSADAIAKAIQAADAGDGVLVLMDLGSAVLSAEVALEMLPEDQRARVMLSDAPIVEGAVVAAVEASIGHSLQEVADATLKARDMPKVSR